MQSFSDRQQRMEEALTRYECYLEMAAPYLQSRGVSQETAEKFRLGFVHDAFPAHKAWTGRLVIPYLDANGGVHNLKARALDDAQPKYLGEAGAEPSLYNVSDLLNDEPTLWIVEGEIDCMILSGEMGLASVAYPGTASWNDVFTRAIGPDWKRIVVVADVDEPGRLAAQRVAKETKGEALELPLGDDVNSIYVKHGPEGLAMHLGIEWGDDDSPPF